MIAILCNASKSAAEQQRNVWEQLTRFVWPQKVQFQAASGRSIAFRAGGCMQRVWKTRSHSEQAKTAPVQANGA